MAYESASCNYEEGNKGKTVKACRWEPNGLYNARHIDQVFVAQRLGL